MSDQTELDKELERWRKQVIARARAADPAFDAQCAEEDRQRAEEQATREAAEAARKVRPVQPAAQQWVEVIKRMQTPRPPEPKE